MNGNVKGVIYVNDLHVDPYPDELLRDAAEAADSRVVVSVPDRSPVGVRVLRVNDVAMMLQRVGRVVDIGVTDKGTIVAAADVCERKGEVAIWTGWAIGPWHPSDIVARGLGGSETAAVRLAEELAAMGYVVTLYGQFEQEGLVGDVMLRDFQKFDRTRPIDAFIGFRDATQFDDRPNARFTALWLEDLPGQERLTPERSRNIDRVCCVSAWHKNATIDAYPWLALTVAPQAAGSTIVHNKVVACRNGIVHRWFEEQPAPERDKRVVFSSSPDRGLDVLLELWPKVLERVPDAKLISTYSRWYDLCADRFQQGNEHRKRVMQLLDDLPGATRVHGGMGQKALSHLMRASMVWAHPSWWSGGDMEFHETSCISAMEAQAAGCVVVASAWGALTETVEHGTLVGGDPREKDGSWQRLFVDAIVRGLTDKNTQEAAQEIGPERVRDMDWRGAAEQLAHMFDHERMPA